MSAFTSRPSRWVAAMISMVLVLFSLGFSAHAAGAATAPRTLGTVVADYAVAQWRVVEIPLTSTAAYADPFADVQVSATFHGPGGITVHRPAFWDGGPTWKVRFAPTQTGTWTMTTSASNHADLGLDHVTKTIAAVPYTGSLAIYKHGFVAPSADGHYLQYADSTPFLYLGDTHWVLPHERFDTSNAPGVRSQFKYVVDKRVHQGFTVYQSEPIWQPHGSSDLDAHTHYGPDEEPVADLTDGMQATDLAGFHNLDRKFAYIADAGLVHANAMISWVGQPHQFPSAMTPDFMTRMARYWDARYGAYPVIWTIGQEIDKDFYGRYAGSAMAPWTAAIEELDRVDDYNHPIMPHQENIGSTTSQNSRFAGAPWHDGFASQWQSTDDWNVQVAKDYWGTGQPTVAYETPYEDFWTDSRHALSAFYKSYLLGMRGYGYGVSGVWNDVYSAPGQPLDAGTAYELPARYQWWFDGANRATGDELTFGVQFFRGLKWWQLAPRFDDRSWSDFTSGNNFLASDGNRTYVALFADGTTQTGRLKGMDPRHYYTTTWFNPRTGARTKIDDRAEALDGSWTVPTKPTTDDWVLLAERGKPLGATPSRPIIGPSDGDYTRSQQVAMQSPTVQAEIRYTTDGTLPTSSSRIYSGPIRVSDPADVTVRAIAISSNDRQSSVATAVFRHSLQDSAAGAVVTADSTAQGASPENVTDRDPTTEWSPSTGGESWLQAAYTSDTTIDTILLTGGGDVSYRVDYAESDGWHTADEGTLTIGPTGSGSVITFPQIKTRKLRLVLAPRGPESQLSVNELGTYDDPDLTTGGTASASSTLATEFAPANAIDSDPATAWRACEQCSDGTWFELDFGQPTTFDTVDLQPAGGWTGQVRVEYDDGGEWVPAAGGTVVPGSSATSVTFPEKTSSRLRVSFVPGGAEGPGLQELSVFYNPDLTVGGTYAASSSWDANQTANKAFDGSMDTNWQACNGCWAGQWLEVDFHQQTTFNQVAVSEYDDRTTGYRIEYWDGSTWQTAYTGSGGFGQKGETTTVSFPPVTGTKARILYLSGNASAPIVYELSVYGPADPPSS